jgi:hypothetical protein
LWYGETFIKKGWPIIIYSENLELNRMIVPTGGIKGKKRRIGG